MKLNEKLKIRYLFIYFCTKPIIEVIYGKDLSLIGCKQEKLLLFLVLRRLVVKGGHRPPCLGYGNPIEIGLNYF